MNRHRTSLLLAVLMLLLLSAVGCKEEAAPRTAPPAVPIVAAVAVERTVPIQLRAIGTVEAYSTVAIKAQISAEVTSVGFQEGQDVRKGDLLFSLDKRPFETAQSQAEANLARYIALGENARAQAQRYAKLFEQGVVSREIYDQNRSQSDAYDAAVRADRAAVEQAKLELGYCTIKSPIDGRTGSLMMHAGNIVKANDTTAMVIINQVTPIYVSFAVPQKYLDQVRRPAEGKLPVDAWPPGETSDAEHGVVSFIDNAVDDTTGTIRLKGTFANPQRRLWPGQFVDTVLTVGVQPHAVVIPAAAVQTSQAGSFVFVVKPDMTVEMRSVVVTRTQATDAILEKGVSAGERVVTDGQLNLVPGAKVSIKESGAKQ